MQADVRRDVVQAEVFAQAHLAGRIVRGARHHAARRLLRDVRALPLVRGAGERILSRHGAFDKPLSDQITNTHPNDCHQRKVS